MNCSETLHTSLLGVLKISSDLSHGLFRVINDLIHVHQALAVWNIIDPGLTKDRGSLLKDLSVTKKLILKRDLVGGLISDEEFSKEVQHCVELFNESQECVLMRVKRMFKK